MGLEEVWLPILGYEDRYGVTIQQQKKRSDDLSDSITEFI